MSAWVAPASLQALSVLLEFLDQSQGDLDQARAGRRALDDIRWHLAGREE